MSEFADRSQHWQLRGAPDKIRYVTELLNEPVYWGDADWRLIVAPYSGDQSVLIYRQTPETAASHHRLAIVRRVAERKALQALGLTPLAAYYRKRKRAATWSASMSPRARRPSSCGTVVQRQSDK